MSPETTDDDSVRGDVLVIALIVSLLTFMFITFSTAAYFLRGDDWLVLVAPAARLTHSASFGMGAFCAIDAFRRGRNGWWLYLLAAGVPLLQWAIVVYWLKSGRATERRILRWQI